MSTTDKKQSRESKSSRTSAKNKKKKTVSPKPKKKKQSSWKWKIFKFALLLGFILFIALGSYIFYCYLTMPDIKKAISRTRDPSTVILAENGNEIAKFGNIYAQVIYPENLPKNLTNAIIATEDRRFYSHSGFDFIGFTRAMATNIFHRRYAQGASTVSQQVAKNIFLTPNKNIKRKVQELLLAYWLEKKLTKKQIMALYLNRAYFGSGNYGAEAAANWYFNKNVHQLNLHEAAILAGMLKAPNKYNPILQRDNSLKRAEVVLENMKKNRFISEKQYHDALKMPINNGQQYRVTGGKHFAQYAYDKANELIGERTDDIIVITTLDQKLQETAEKILRSKIYAAKDKNVTEGAVIIMDKTGEIKAMVGGIDYNRSQFNRAVQAKRQPGSSFKPFVYITALQYGFTPESTISDSPITIGKWKPENYTKHYYGDVTLSYALIHSLNAATVNLSRELSLKDIANNAHNMGVTSDINLTPSMVLGTSAVRVIDMITAYATIANGGKRVRPHVINEITTTDSRQLYIRQAEDSNQILEPSVVQNITSMMEKVINQGTGQKARLPIFAAGKTGTTQNYRDAWFIGWTNKYIAAVWVGNDDDKPMKKIGGGNLPAEIWHDIMLTTIKDTPVESNVISETTTDDIAELIDETNDSDSIGELIEKEENTPENIEELIDSI